MAKKKAPAKKAGKGSVKDLTAKSARSVKGGFVANKPISKLGQ